MNGFSLIDLDRIVSERSSATADKSYTRSLLDKGAVGCSKKFGEEAVELVIAATQSDPKAVTAEAADVIYHLMVLLHAAGVPLHDVMSELERRTASSGHAEKASRGTAG